MDICPNSVDWGNLADWASVIVAAVVGYLVWRLTAAANRIATEAHDSRKNSEDRETTNIALLAFREMRMASVAFEELVERIEMPDAGEQFISNSEFRLAMLSFVTGIQRSDAGQNPQVLARLPQKVASDVMLAWAHIDTLVERIRASRVVETTETQAKLFEALIDYVPITLRQCETATVAALEVMSKAHIE